MCWRTKNHLSIKSLAKQKNTHTHLSNQLLFSMNPQKESYTAIQDLRALLHSQSASLLFCYFMRKFILTDHLIKSRITLETNLCTSKSVLFFLGFVYYNKKMYPKNGRHDFIDWCSGLSQRHKNWASSVSGPNGATVWMTSSMTSFHAFCTSRFSLELLCRS